MSLRVGLVALVTASALAVPTGSVRARTLELQFHDAAGQVVTLAQLRGRPVLIDVWASWCTACLPGLSAMQRLAGRFGNDVAVVPLSVDRGGAASAVRAYLRLGIRQLPLYVTDAATVTASLGVTDLPTALLLDASGAEVARFSGRDWQEDHIIAEVVKLLGLTAKASI